ncbi:MAG: winged helix-turn-helix domain-containing protein [Pyrinomonadaceae bacterium]
MSSELTSKELQFNFKMRETAEQRVYEFEDFRLDAEHLLLFRSGEQLKLTPKVVETLLVLIENDGEVVAKDELMVSLWPRTVVEESNLSQNLYLLRRALGNNKHGEPFIETLRRRGYRFCGDVSYSRVSNGNGLNHRPIQVSRTDNIYAVADWNRNRQQQNPVKARNWQLAAAAFALIAILLIAGGFVFFRSNSRAETQKNVGSFELKSIERLTTSGQAKHAALSPNGRYLAHVTETSQGMSLWLRQVSSSVDVPIAGPLASEIVWTGFAPDGENIYYLALDRDKGETELFRVPTLGGPSALAVRDSGPVGFSADGKSIAFVRMYDKESRLIVAGADGSNESVIASKTEPDVIGTFWNAPTWSPDGSSIAAPTKVTDTSGSFMHLIAYGVSDRFERILTSTRWARIGEPRWTSNGIFMIAAETASSPEQIWQIAADDGTASRITQDLNITADGERVSAIQEQTHSSIAVGTDRDNLKQIAAEVGYIEQLAWTPDGRIAYISGANGEIWTMDAYGSNARQLTTGAKAVAGLTVAPDRSQIVFSSERSGKPNLWRVNSNGSELTQLTSGESETYPQYSPDGKWIVYQSGDFASRLWRMPSDGGEAVRITETMASRPSISPDGKLVAYRYLDSTFERSRWSIGVVSIEGGPQLMRFDLPNTMAERFVRFTPDGRSIAFPNIENGTADIWIQPLNSGRSRRLTRSDSPNIQSFDWSKDGKSLATIRTTVTRDAVMLKR